MKKVLALVVSIAMLSCFAVSANADGTATFQVDTKEAAVGDTVEISVSVLEENTNIGAAEMYIDYDKTQLEIVANARGKYFAAGQAGTDAGASIVGSEAYNVDDHEIKIALASADGIYTTGAIVTMNFKVLNLDKQADIMLTVADGVKDINIPAGNVTVTAVNGAIKAKAGISANGQSVIDMINALGEIDLNSKEAIAAARAAYEALSAEDKALIPADILAKLTAAEALIAELEASEPEISEPATSEPATSEPEISEPATSEPEISEPATSEPIIDEEPSDEEPADEEPSDEEPSDEEPADGDVTPTEPSDGGNANAGDSNVAPNNGTGNNNNTPNPGTADNSALAFAGILCAAMAAAYVVTKKVND